MRPFIGPHDTIEPMRAVHVLYASAFAAVLACGGSPDDPQMTDRTAGGPPDNVLDPTFGTNGIFTWGAAHEQSERGDAVIRQADGKIAASACVTSARCSPAEEYRRHSPARRPVRRKDHPVSKLNGSHYAVEARVHAKRRVRRGAREDRALTFHALYFRV